MTARNSSSVAAPAASWRVSLGSALATMAGASATGLAGASMARAAALTRRGAAWDAAKRSTGVSPTARSTPAARYHSSAASASASFSGRVSVMVSIMPQPAGQDQLKTGATVPPRQEQDGAASSASGSQGTSSGNVSSGEWQIQREGARAAGPGTGSLIATSPLAIGHLPPASPLRDLIALAVGPQKRQSFHRHHTLLFVGDSHPCDPIAAPAQAIGAAFAGGDCTGRAGFGFDHAVVRRPQCLWQLSGRPAGLARPVDR